MWPGDGTNLKSLFKSAKSFVVRKTVETVGNVIQGVKDAIFNTLENAEIEASVEINTSAGWQGGGGLTGHVEAYGNAGRVEIAAYKVGVVVSQDGIENVTGWDYIGKDGDIEYKSHVAGSVGTESLGGGVEVYNQGVVNISSNGIKVTENNTGGKMSIGSAYGTNVTYDIGKNIDGQKYEAYSIGAAGEVGKIIAVEAEAKFEFKRTKVDEDE